MNKHKHAPRRTAKANAAAPGPPRTVRDRAWLRYAAYAILVAGAIGLSSWMTGPKVPAPALENLDDALVEEIENARAEIWAAPANAEKWGRLGMLYAAHSFPVEALECFERAEELNASQWKWAYLRAITLEQSDPAAALSALNEAAEAAAGDDELPRMLLVERLIELGERDEAQRHLQVALRHWPEHPRVHLNRARLLWVRDDPRGALVALQKAASDRHTQRMAQQLLVQVHRRLADHGATAAAEERLAKLPPDEAWPDRWREAIDAFRTSKGAYIARIDELGRRGDFGRLARVAAESISRYPELAHLVKGRERLSQGDLVAAERALREAVRLDPGSVDAWLSLGEALMRQGKVDAAVEAFRQATQVDSAHGGAHLQLAEALAAQGDRAAALASFHSAVQYMPTSPEAHRALADALAKSGEAAAADEHRRQAEQLTAKKKP